MNAARYYLGRVMKRGQLDNHGVISAIMEPSTVSVRRCDYTFAAMLKEGNAESPKYIFAKLDKCCRMAEVEFLEREAHQNIKTEVADLVEAYSNFVYIPEFYGIAYQHVSGQIPRDKFERMFSALVEKHGKQFFVGCDIEPISDLRTFTAKLARIPVVQKIHVRVTPPNPLFGPVWGPLREHLAKRRTENMTAEESTKKKEGIKTRIPYLVRNGLDSDYSEFSSDFNGGEHYSVTDAALLMAIDGFGQAKVEGIDDRQQKVILKTKDSQISFSMEKDPSPDALYRKAYRHFSKIHEARHLRRGR